MNKKELRKALELELVKSIEEQLTKKNSGIAKQLKKHIETAARLLAKKYVKQLKAKAAPKKTAVKSVKKASPKKAQPIAKKQPAAKTVRRKK